jgi:hypothetical protein
MMVLRQRQDRKQEQHEATHDQPPLDHWKHAPDRSVLAKQLRGSPSTRAQQQSSPRTLPAISWSEGWV